MVLLGEVTPQISFGDTLLLSRGLEGGDTSGIISVRSGRGCVQEVGQDVDVPTLPSLWCFVPRPVEGVETSGESGTRGVVDIGDSIVRYGQTVCLRHVISPHVLCLRRGVVSDLTGQLEAFLGDPRGEGCEWDVIPASKARSRGQPVLDGDSVFLVQHTLAFPLQDVQGSLCGAHETGTVWRVARWTRVEASSLLTFGDALFIRNRENEGVMGGISVRVEQTEEEPFLWNASTSRTMQEGVGSWWEIVRSKTLLGGPVRWGDCFLLRHILTGKYLTIAEGEQEDKDTRGQKTRKHGGEASLLGGLASALDTVASAIKVRVEEDATQRESSQEDRAPATPHPLALATERTDHCLWKLIPLDRSVDMKQPVSRSAIVRLCHRGTDMCLHIVAPHEERDRKRLVVSPFTSCSDIWYLTTVAPISVYDFYECSRSLTSIRECVDLFVNDTASPTTLSTMRQSLASLIRMLSGDRRRRGRVQSLLIFQDAARLCHFVLGHIRSNVIKSGSGLRSVAVQLTRQVLELVSCMANGSTVSVGPIQHTFLANDAAFLRELVEQNAEDIGIFELLRVIWRNGIKLLWRMSPSEVEAWLAIARRWPHLRSQCYRFLAMLCASEAESLLSDAEDEVGLLAVRSRESDKVEGARKYHQDVIGCLLFTTFPDLLHVYTWVDGEMKLCADGHFHPLWEVSTHVELDGEDLLWRCCQNTSEAVTITLHDASAPTKDAALRTVAQHHTAMLVLVTALCSGNSPANEERLIKALPLEDLLSILKDPRVHFLLKIHILWVVRVVHILNFNSRKFHVDCLRFWDVHEDLLKEMNHPNDAQQALLDWLLQLLEEVNQRSRNEAELIFLRAALQCLRSMILYVKHGLFTCQTDSLSGRLVDGLYTLLTADLHSDMSEAGKTSVGQLFDLLRIEVCQILLALRAIFTDRRLDLALRTFRNMDTPVRFASEVIMRMSDHSIEKFAKNLPATCMQLLASPNFALVKLALLLLIRHHRLIHDTTRSYDRIKIVFGAHMAKLNLKFSVLLNEISAFGHSSTVVVKHSDVIISHLSTLIDSIRRRERKVLIVDKPVQDLLRELDAHQVVCNVLATGYCDAIRKLFLRCYDFLYYFSKENMENQEELLPFLTLMQSHMGHELGIAKILSAMFEEDIQLGAALTSDQLGFFCHLLITGGKRPRYLRLLIPMCFTKNRAQKCNQDFILRFLRSHMEETFLLWTKEEDRAERRERSRQREHVKHPEGLLSYHIAFVDLLAATAQKRNEFAQNFCRAILPLEDVMVALADDLPADVKAPFWHFLQSVYLDTDASSLTDAEQLLLRDVTVEFNHTLSPASLKGEGRGLETQRNLQSLLPYFSTYVLPCLHVFMDNFVLVERERLEGQAIASETTLSRITAWESLVRETQSNLVQIADSLLKLYFLVAPPTVAEIATSPSSSSEEGVPPSLATALECFLRGRDIVSLPETQANAIHAVLSKIANKPARRTAAQLPFEVEERTSDNNPETIGKRWDEYLAFFKERVQDTIDHDNLLTVRQMARLDEVAYEAFISQLDERNMEDTGYIIHLLDVLMRVVEFRDAGSGTMEMKDRGTLKERQDLVDKLGGTQRVIRLLSSPNLHISYKALQTLHLLLSDGNLAVQRTVLDFISRGDTNKSSEVDDHLDAITDARDFHLLEAINSTLQESYKDAKATPWWIRAQATVSAAQCVPSGKEWLRLSMTLQFIKELCEGHNQEAQELLRVQKRDTHINIIEALVQYLDALIPPAIPSPIRKGIKAAGSNFGIPQDCTNMLETWYEPLFQTLTTLIEVVQGPCVGNQQTILYGQGPEALRSLLSLAMTIERLEWDKTKNVVFVQKVWEETKMERRVFLQTAVLLTSLVEGTEFLGHIHVLRGRNFIEALHGKLHVYGWLYNMFHRNPALRAEILEEGMVFFVLLGYLTIDISRKPGSERILPSPHHALWEHHIGQIEIIREDHVEPFLFQKDPLSVQWLTSEDKETILWEVDRSTQNDKIEDFYSRSEDLYEALRIRQEINSSRFKRVITHSRLTVGLRIGMNLLAVLINILVVFSSTSVDDDADFDAGIWFLGSLILLLLLLLQVSYYFKDYKIHLLATRKRAGARAKADTNDNVAQTVADLEKKSINTVRAYYYLIHIVFAILGLAHSPYWFSFHLVDIVAQSPILLNVLRSVTKPRFSILLTMALIALVVYYYAIFGFLYFEEGFYKDEPGDEKLCNSLASCWVAIVAQFPSGGDYLRERFTRANEDSLNTPGAAWEVIFQLSFFVIIMIILLNILLGIIVDTFSALREEREKILEDLHGRCFVCGLDASVYDREGNGFEAHIRSEHPTWDYFHAYCFIMEKFKRAGGKETEFSGTESFLYQCIKNHDTSYFPINRRSFQMHPAKDTEKDQERKEYEDLFRGVQNEVEKINTRLLRLEGDLKDKEVVLSHIWRTFVQRIQREEGDGQERADPTHQQE